MKRWLRLALAVPLMGYVVWSLRGQTDIFMAALTWSSLPWLAVSACLLILAILLLAMRQSLLLGHAGFPLPLADSVRISFVGLFANNIIPAGMGYDVTRLIYLRTQSGQTLGLVGGLLILDRLLGLMGLSLLTVCALAFLSLFYADTVPNVAGRLLVYATILPLPLGAVILALRHGNSFDLISRLAGRLPQVGGAITQLLSGMRVFSTRKRVLLATLGLSTFGHLCTVAGVATIAWGLYGQRAALGSVLVSPLVLFAASVPVTPSNLGWTEAVAEAAWTAFGLKGGMVIFLVWRMVSVAVSLIGMASGLKMLGQVQRSGKQ